MPRRAVAAIARKAARRCVRVLLPTVHQVRLADERAAQAERSNAVFPRKALHDVEATVPAGQNHRHGNLPRKARGERGKERLAPRIPLGRTRASRRSLRWRRSRVPPAQPPPGGFPWARGRAPASRLWRARPARRRSRPPSRPRPPRARHPPQPPRPPAAAFAPDAPASAPPSRSLALVVRRQASPEADSPPPPRCDRRPPPRPGNAPGSRWSHRRHRCGGSERGLRNWLSR